MRISSLYRQQQLSIGILDVSSVEVLKEAVDWYVANMNCTLHVITLEETFEKEGLGSLYPDVTFICFNSLVTLGEQINAFASECYASCFLVVRSDLQILGFEGGSLMALMADKSHPAMLTPVMLNQDMELMPTIRTPYLKGKEIEPMSFMPSIEPGSLTPNLYPVMALGLYDRALFQRLRVYDTQITGEFFQMADFGIRCYLLGYNILATRNIVIQFPQKISIVEDRSPCEGMERFYTKAMSIRRIAGKNMVEKWKPYVDKALLNEEVKKKQIILQKTDFFTLMDNWKVKE